ncbi:MAG TPA: hypothetical protein VJR90_01085 [Gammaproteobacteria bacterium]|nr:hypothetical protein [Gammaproteobacteria bacterium]
MASTTFSGPVTSKAGFVGTLTGNVTGSVTGSMLSAPIASASLPAATTALAGSIRIINNNGVSNNEYCLVICTGTAWVTATGQPLT